MGMGSNGELKYEISQNAYIKLVLHSLRHKTAAVNGVLVGRISPKDDGVVEISDSVPLFHSNLALLPPLEISLIMIEEHYVAQGLSIVGYFHANERFDDVELCGVAKNIGDHISRYFPQAPILLVSKCLILCLWNALARQEAKGCEYPVFRASLRLMLRSPKRNIVVQYSAGFRIRKWDSKHLLLIVKNHLEAKENLKYGRHRYKLTSVEKPSTKSIKMKQRWKETAFSISCLF